MKAASAPRSAAQHRVLVVESGGAGAVCPASALPELLRAGDLVVVNDAATLPATLYARTADDDPVELRLVGATGTDERRIRFWAALLGAGDYRTRTEDRPLPPRVVAGDLLRIGSDLEARVLGASAISSRLLDIELCSRGDVASTWAALYRAGRPVQYAHVPEALALWDVQNAWAGRPWAVEMPSAGRAVRVETLLELRRRGVEIAFVTHAAGLSATGDPAIDAMLPLPERFEVAEPAVRAVQRARARGGRVVAVGTSVVRALESAARDGVLRATTGTTDLRLGLTTVRHVVDALLTGVHEADTTHFELLRAFAERAVLDDALSAAEREGLLGHELGDAWLVWGAPATSTVAARAERARCAATPCAASATVAA